MTEHLDLDALADVLAGLEGDSAAHVAVCAPCQGRLAELAAAMPAVSQALAALPAPTPPAGLEERLLSAVTLAADETTDRTADVLPLVRNRMRWLPALGSVAAAAVLVTGGVLLAQDGGRSTTTNDAAGAPTYAVNASGTDYSARSDSLSAALPALLAGASAEAADVGASPLSATESKKRTGGTAPQAAPAVADPLSALRTTDGLARCLASLTDPSEVGLPLALDYASFEGTPALVVVLPSSAAGKVDVLVVPAGCAEADGQLLYFTRLPKP